MSSYYTPRKVVIGRYWKRPKPKIYECNVRDAERFYQDTYRDYLQNKEYAARRYSEDGETSRYGVQRSNSLLRDNSELLASSNFNDSSSRYGDESYRASNSVRASSVTNNGRDSPEGELASIEQRLQRLRTLRQDLGLPTETSNDTGYKSSLSSTSRVSARQSSPLETTRSTESSYSSSRRTRGGDSESYGRDKYSFKDSDSVTDNYGSDRSKGFSSNYASSSTENSYKPSSKAVSFETTEDFGTSKRYNKYDDGPSEASSYKSSSKSYGSGRQASASAATNDTLDYDDEDFVSNLKKKFVSSNEILERIKKMNDDI